MRTDVTYLGPVRRVVGAKVLVEVSPALPSANPIIEGHLYRLGQVGTFVRIPLGYVNLFGIVATVGASELTSSEGLPESAHGQRWMEVQLIGESVAGQAFQRGVSLFPTIDDEVHIVVEKDLAIIYGAASPGMVEIGWHVASESLRATIDIDRIVTRHAAIVGSTGSGKSNTVAAILKSLTDGEFPNARIIIVDPHGEYGAALQDRARVFAIGDALAPLSVPYWALSFDELGWFLVDRRTATESLQDAILREAIFDQKRELCTQLRAGPVNPGEITIDSPIPFSIRDLWYQLDRKERVTYEDMPRSREALVQEGDPQSLTSARFRPPGAGSAAPFKPTQTSIMGSYVNKMLGRLKDRRFDFLLNPDRFDGLQADLNDLCQDWLGHDRPITVFDLGGVPAEIIDLVVGVITRIIFECCFWGRNVPGVGRQRPALLVYEEAHTYLPSGTGQFIGGYAGRAVRRLAREGRKYGIGAIVVSQRPAELDETVLSQCGTFFALRLSNTDDQARIRATLPDALAGLTELLPALRTGEAIVLGEAVQIPSRIRIPLVEPRPKSNDPKPAERWKEQVRPSEFDRTVTAWRRQET